MSEVDSERTHWAILIGVGVTTDSTVSSQGGQNLPRGRSLRGAVPDVVTIKEYLGTVSTPVDIIMLTVTELADDDGSGPKLLPTYKNVISELKRVIDFGKPGQFVYIHYSGHGTRRNVGQ